MNSLFPWLDAIFNGLGQFLPRILLMDPTMESVLFRFGNMPKVITHENGIFNTGIHLYLPLITSVYSTTILEQNFDLFPQLLVTNDGFKLRIEGILVCHVVDTLKLFTKGWEISEIVVAKTSAAIKRLITANDYETILSTEFDELLKEEVAAKLEHYGIELDEVTLSDICDALVIVTPQK